MSLDRNTVQKGIREHIRQLQELGNVTDEQKREIEKLHQRTAERVARRAQHKQ